MTESSDLLEFQRSILVNSVPFGNEHPAYNGKRRNNENVDICAVEVVLCRFAKAPRYCYIVAQGSSRVGVGVSTRAHTHISHFRDLFSSIHLTISYVSYL